MKRIILTILSALFVAVPTLVHAQSDFLYTTNGDGTLTITQYTGTNGTIVIPSTISNLTVTSISDFGEPVFPATTTISVTVPSTVISLGGAVFENCTNLQSVLLPDSIMAMDEGVFEDCTALASIKIPAGLTALPAWTFDGCTNLSNVVIPPNITIINEGVFEDCYNLQNVVIPATVTTIGYEAFKSAGMTNLVIGTNAPSASTGCIIGNEAFKCCTNIANVVIGTSVALIEDEAFSRAIITNLVIGANGSVNGIGTTIGSEAFKCVQGLTNVTIGNSVVEIGYEAFYETSVTNVTIGNGTAGANGGSVIDYEAFERSYLLNLTIGKSVSIIGEDAFYECYDLSSANIDASIIGGSAFYDATALTNLTIGPDVTQVGESAFEECHNLTNAYIGAGAILEDAFEDCYALSNLTFGPKVTSIGEYAFDDCTGLASVAIPDSVVSLGLYAFDYCTNLSNVTIGGGITEIPYQAFEECYALNSVTFGPNVVQIDAYAFGNATNLHSIYFQGNAPHFSSESFAGDDFVGVFYYGNTAGWNAVTNFFGFPATGLAQNSLTVNLGPSSAIAAGASWTLDGVSVYTAPTTTLVNLAPGGHTVTFASISGWTTPSNQVVVVTNAVTVGGFYIPTNAPASGLIVLTNGPGIIDLAGLGKTVTIGKNYKITAIPNAGALFVGWTGGTNQPFTTLATTPALTFTMKSNLVLVATFVTNPFIAVSGTYNGLFTTTNGADEATSGMLSALTISTKGSYSGKLLIAGASYTVTGSFDTTGVASNNIVRKATAGGNLTLNMLFSTTDGSTPLITGTVSGSNNAAPFTANLTAEEAANTLPSAVYTMLIFPDTNNTPPTNSPGGEGYASITYTAGTAKNPGAATTKITGILADGTAFSQTVPAAADGSVPVYVNLSAEKGLLLGWINLTITNTDGVGLTWIHGTTTKGLYTNGFTNVMVPSQLPLAVWSTPTTPITSLTNLVLENVVGEGGSDIAITVSAAGKITGPQVSGSVTLKTGVFKVTYGTGANKLSGGGAILLNAPYGGGYFTTKTDAGAFELTP